ncbi:MAG: hypothetical protein ACU843_17845, partial [Gammaproteobacteria bacterium]
MNTLGKKTCRGIPRIVLLIVCLISQPLLAQQSADLKIDANLLSTLTSSPTTTARFFVVFHERASLDGPSRISDRIPRGRAVVHALQETADRAQAGVRGSLSARGVPFTAFWVINTVLVPQGTLR